MRYSITSITNAADYQYVLDTQGPVFGACTEAEANIIAFALNAVAEGDSLYRCHPNNDVLTPYTGPTEGVAPDAH